MAKFKFGPNNAKDATDSELQISAPVSPVDKQVGFTPATPLIPAELQKAEDALANFQQGIQAKIFASQVLASTMSSVLRREYLEGNDLKFGSSTSFQGGKIAWLKLKQVGIDSKTPIDYAEALEKLIQTFHLPEKYQIIFLATSNGTSLEIHIGIKYMNDFGSDELGKSLTNLLNNFTKATWPGISFETMSATPSGLDELLQEKNVTNKSGKSEVRYKSGIRAISGIPAFRNDQSNSKLNTIDQLANSLRGKKWSYMVIADPISNSEMDKILFQCREFAGRAESMKSFQLGENFNASFSKAFSEAYGKTHSKTHGTSSPVGGMMGKLGAAAVSALPLALLTLGVVCPAAIPAVATATLAKIGAMGLGSVAAISGGMAVNGIAQALRGVNKTKSESESESENWQQTISETVSIAKGASFGETIVNKHADMLAKLLETHDQRYSLCEALGAWDVGAYFIGEDELTADIGCNVLRSLQSGENSYYEPIRIHKLSNPMHSFDKERNPGQVIQRFENPDIFLIRDEEGNILHHPLGWRLDSVRTILNSREMTHFINFPTKNVPGIEIRNALPQTGLSQHHDGKGTINIGQQMFNGEIIDFMPWGISVKSLAKHALVCGINGSGKTNTIMGILAAIGKENIPFLVIEPAKQEYVDWAMESNQKLIKEMGSEAKARASEQWINIFIPGRTSWRGRQLDKLYLNPFDFVWLNRENSPKTLEHIDRLKTIVNAALPMQEALPVLMEELIYMAYAVQHAPTENVPRKYPCWLPQGNQDRYPEFWEMVHIPNFQELARLIPVLFQKRNYGKDVSLNLKAALSTRVDSFKRGWRKELLNKDYPRYQKEDWEKIFEHPTVINLTSLTSDEDKAFFMAIILLFVYEYRQELNECISTAENADASLKHLLVIEEAHRILGKCEGALAGNAAPKQKVSEMFSNMISEVRAYGQGIMVADQVPCRLNDDAIKNTNLKIVHKLVAADDKNAMATALNLWDDQVRIIGDLNVGETLIRGDMDKDVYMVKINKNK